MTIYETRNLHRASELLYISQQGLSRVLASMEKEFQVTFFKRTNAGLEPTPAGDYFYQLAAKTQKQFQKLESDLKNLETVREELRMACCFGSMTLYYRQIRNFYDANPKIWLHWTEYTDVETERVLKNGEADIALIVTSKNQNALKTYPLSSHKLSVLIYKGHPYFDRESLTLTDLMNEQIIMNGPQLHIYNAFKEACMQEGFVPNIIAETTDLTLCGNLVRMKEGIGIIVEVVANMYNRDDLHVIPLDAENLRWELAVAHMAGKKLNGASKKLLDFLLKLPKPS